MNKLAQKYANFIIKNRQIILIVTGFLTLVMAFFIKDLDIGNDFDAFLPEFNRYVVTKAYGEQPFVFSNIMVVGFILKDCVGGNNPYADADKLVRYDLKTELRINESATQKMTQAICEGAGGIWQPNQSQVYQPWFVNMVQKVHNKMVALNHAKSENFIDIAAQNIKYMGTTKKGRFKFERLIPTEGIHPNNRKISSKQLAHLKKGLESNPVLAPMLLLKEDAQGKRCEFGQENCSAQGLFIIGDYADSVKENDLSWTGDIINIIDEVKAKYGDRVVVRIARVLH